MTHTGFTFALSTPQEACCQQDDKSSGLRALEQSNSNQEVTEIGESSLHKKSLNLLCVILQLTH